MKKKKESTSEKSKMRNSIMEKIQNSRPFKARFCTILCTMLRPSSDNILQRKFKLAKMALDKRLDVLSYLKKARYADTLAKLTLDRSHKKLMPYFNNNILNLNSTSCVKPKGTQLTREADLKDILKRSRVSKIDRKVVDALFLPQTDQQNSQEQEISPTDAHAVIGPADAQRKRKIIKQIGASEPVADARNSTRRSKKLK